MSPVHELNLGLLEPPGGPIGLSGCRCLLLDTQNGFVLIDTGFGTAELQFPEKFFGDDVDTMLKITRDPSLSALSQVEAPGLRRRDVRHIVCTHLDMDHAGGLVDFPHAALHVAALEHDDLMSGSRLLTLDLLSKAIADNSRLFVISTHDRSEGLPGGSHIDLAYSQGMGGRIGLKLLRDTTTGRTS